VAMLMRPDDEHFMRIAIETAKRNSRHPFAALLVDRRSDSIIGTGLNAASAHPLRHGEIAAIEDAIAKQEHVEWGDLTLYSTAEPCCMCQAAILWCGISEVVYGTRVATLRRLGWSQFVLDANQVVEAAPFRSCSLRRALESECDALFTSAGRAQ